MAFAYPCIKYLGMTWELYGSLPKPGSFVGFFCKVGLCLRALDLLQRFIVCGVLEPEQQPLMKAPILPKS